MKNDKSKLPTLTEEQATEIVSYLRANYDDSNLDWDGFCCESDVAPDAYELAVETFAKAYGIFKEAKCNMCGKEQTNKKCTNSECSEYEDPDEEEPEDEESEEEEESEYE